MAEFAARFLQRGERRWVGDSGRHRSATIPAWLCDPGVHLGCDQSMGAGAHLPAEAVRMRERTKLLVAQIFTVVAVCAFLFFFGLGAFGLVGADEPRYAQIGREMLA